MGHPPPLRVLRTPGGGRGIAPVKAGEPEPSILDQAPDEAVAEYIKEKGVALPPDDPRAWKSGELILYGVWHARQPPEVKGLPFETKQDRFRVEMAEAGPPA